MLADGAALLQALLLVEELLGLPENVLQLRQLEEVLLQGLRVLVYLPIKIIVNQTRKSTNKYLHSSVLVHLPTKKLS